MRNVNTHYPFHNDFDTNKNKSFAERLEEQVEGVDLGEAIEYTGEGDKGSYDPVVIKGINLDGSFLV